MGRASVATAANSATVGNGWAETEASGATAQIASNRLELSSNDANIRPIVQHTFASQSSGTVTWSFNWDWTRSGNEGTYELYMQLGNSAAMNSRRS